ncbi:potassium:proton antiporter [Pseudodesulfovibrio portus]|uniref:Potassium:proton antiporter n=1 Tax=Pseudodesulfovibrio portus TaxID=231439 RepID=A0ABM8ANE9_9BACT|nr:potassium:proton antiporter [Pseudodesulfovibrio portus]BDQ32891.1 hypothetical protein JCM14722_04330 [Pseudodesulfovibrio portus]
MLKSLGFLSWAACLLTLAYQSVSWVLFNNWPELDMFSVLNTLFGLDLLSIVETLPLDATAKLLYVALTTELALFLWWTGVAMFVLMLIIQLVRK